ncbi:type III secretion system regulator LcrR, partial [Vibrio parahaemolyticus VPTS-2010]
LKKRKM